MPAGIGTTNTDHTADGLGALAKKCGNRAEPHRLRAVGRVVEGTPSRGETVRRGSAGGRCATGSTGTMRGSGRAGGQTGPRPPVEAGREPAHRGGALTRRGSAGRCSSLDGRPGSGQDQACP